MISFKARHPLQHKKRSISICALFSLLTVWATLLEFVCFIRSKHQLFATATFSCHLSPYSIARFVSLRIKLRPSLDSFTSWGGNTLTSNPNKLSEYAFFEGPSNLTRMSLKLKRFFMSSYATPIFSRRRYFLKSSKPFPVLLLKRAN